MIEVSVVNGEMVEGNGYNYQQDMQMKAHANTATHQQTGITHTLGEGFHSIEHKRECNASDLVRGSGVLSTARNSGMPVLIETDVRDNSVVKISGIEMSALSAAKEGYLVRSPEGNYSEVSGNNLPKFKG